MNRAQEFILEGILDDLYDPMEEKYILNKEQMLRFIQFFASADLEHQHQIVEGNARSITDFVKQEIKHPHETHEYAYDKFNDHFNRMNFENTLTKGEAWKSRDIFEFQTREAKILEEHYHDKAYKQMRSNRIDLIKFHEYQDLVETLKDEIKEDDIENQSIRLYKLERRFNLEIIKTILKTKNEIEKMVLKDLILVMGIPDIEGRHEYVKRYQKLFLHGVQKWRYEVVSLAGFFSRIISAFRVAFPAKRGSRTIFNSSNKARDIYLEEGYLSECTIGEDFEESDFTDLMVELRKINADVLERHKRPRGRPKNE